MNLSEIRDLLVELSGRSDLVQAGAVVDADFFIREGSKVLDRKLFGGKSEARFTTDIESGQILVHMPRCRAIKGVWIYTSEGKARLTKADSLDDVKEAYGQGISGVEAGTPGYYYPLNARSFPEVAVPADYHQIQAFDDLLYNDPTGPLYPSNYVIMNTGGALLTKYHSKHILVNSATPQILTLPVASDTLGIGTTFIIDKAGVGSLTLQAAGSDVINDSNPNGTMYCDDTGVAVLTVVFVGVSTWIANGSNIWTTT